MKVPRKALAKIPRALKKIPNPIRKTIKYGGAAVAGYEIGDALFGDQQAINIVIPSQPQQTGLVTSTAPSISYILCIALIVLLVILLTIFIAIGCFFVAKKAVKSYKRKNEL